MMRKFLGLRRLDNRSILGVCEDCAIDYNTKIVLQTISLLVAAALEAIHLLTSEETPLTTLEVLLCNTCIVYAVELLY